MSHNGLGNRLLSLASSFLYAILTDRVLLIDQGRETAHLLCELFPDTTWALPVDFLIRNLFESFDQNSPHCYGNKLRNKVRDASMDNKSDLPPFIYLNLIYDYGDYDKRFFYDSDQDLIRKVPWVYIFFSCKIFCCYALRYRIGEKSGKIRVATGLEASIGGTPISPSSSTYTSLIPRSFSLFGSISLLLAFMLCWPFFVN
ncbi:hypothetical protein U1Q18_021001 [Sarracenia purpurea var. burkii]